MAKAELLERLQWWLDSMKKSDAPAYEIELLEAAIAALK